MNFKNVLKKNKFIFNINALVKAILLKRGNRKLKNKYQKISKSNQVQYCREAAISTFKNRLLEINPNFFPKTKGNLNILWVGYNFDQDSSGFLQALQKIGNVIIFSNNEKGYGPLHPYLQNGKDYSISFIRKDNSEKLLDKVKELLKRNSIDIILGQMWGHLYDKNYFSTIRQLGVPIINISMDDRLPNLWGYRNGIRLGSIGLTPFLDMVLTTSPETCLYYKIENTPSLYFPLASDPELYFKDASSKRTIDVLFIGNNYGVRGELVNYLSRKGIKISAYGNGWENGFAPIDKSIDLSKNAKIILGIGTVGYSKSIYTLKLRDFDSLMSGALYITHRNMDLLELFTEGQDLECYENPEELFLKISNYLNDENKRIRIAKSGQNKARMLHSWDLRLEEIFKDLSLIKKIN